jgi:hypothetical protein
MSLMIYMSHECYDKYFMLYKCHLIMLNEWKFSPLSHLHYFFFQFHSGLKLEKNGNFSKIFQKKLKTFGNDNIGLIDNKNTHK